MCIRDSIEAGKVAHVIVKDMSRAGRDYLQTGFYTEVFFRQHGVHFVAIANSVDSDEDVYKRQVQTHNTDLKKRLMAFAAKHPQCCRQTDDDEQGGLTFEIEKGRLSFRLTAPYSEERRKAASEAAKQNGVHKKVADLP